MMTRKEYYSFLKDNFIDYLMKLGYNKTYLQGNSIRFEKNNKYIINRIGNDIAMYDSIKMNGMIWAVQFTEINTPIINIISQKEGKSDKMIKEILKHTHSFVEGISLIQDGMDIYNINDAKISLDVLKEHIENMAEPFFAKYSQLRNVYEFLISATRDEFLSKVRGEYYMKLFIYKIYNEEKYQEFLHELMPILEYDNKLGYGYMQGYIDCFDEIVDYIENNVTRLREIYAPEML